MSEKHVNDTIYMTIYIRAMLQVWKSPRGRPPRASCDWQILQHSSGLTAVTAARTHQLEGRKEFSTKLKSCAGKTCPDYLMGSEDCTLWGQTGKSDLQEKFSGACKT